MFEKLTETKEKEINDLIRKLEAAKSDHDTERKKLSLLIEDTKSESEKNVIKLNEQIEKLKGEREKEVRIFNLSWQPKLPIGKRLKLHLTKF